METRTLITVLVVIAVVLVLIATFLFAAWLDKRRRKSRERPRQ